MTLEIDRIAQNGKPDKSAQWSELIRRVRDADKSIDLSYLSRSFEDVESLHEALKLLRSTEVEAYSSKGWTQRQILPLGPDMLLADIKDRSHNSADRLFLRRTGELLYLMLGRSSASQHGSLQQLIRDRMLVRDHACNKLARLIGQGVQTTDSGLDSTARAATGYLPFVKLDAYDRLAEDWGALLSLSRMPIEDILDPLMRLSTFHLIIYLLSVAESVHDKGRSEYPPFVFDLAGRPRKNPMQRSARGQYGNHLSLPRRALEHFVDTFCSSEYWAASAGTTKGAKRAREIITELFRVNEEGSSPEGNVEQSAAIGCYEA